jgi:hypothetical protein
MAHLPKRLRRVERYVPKSQEITYVASLGVQRGIQVNITGFWLLIAIRNRDRGYLRAAEIIGDWMAKKLNQPWGLLLVGVLLILAVVALVFLVFHQ